MQGDGHQHPESSCGMFRLELFTFISLIELYHTCPFEDKIIIIMSSQIVSRSTFEILYM